MINLLPPSIKEARTYTKRNSTMARYIVAVAMITGLALATLAVGSYLLEQEASQVEQQLEQREQEIANATTTANQARELANQIDTVGQLLDGEVQFSQLVPSIASLLPSQASLSSLSLSADTTKPLLLVATVDNQSTAAVMRANIEDSDLFSAADLISISPGANSSRFTVTIQALFNEELPL